MLAAHIVDPLTGVAAKPGDLVERSATRTGRAGQGDREGSELVVRTTNHRPRRYAAG